MERNGGISVAQSCDECGTCIAVCPVDAIVLDKLVSIDVLKCIACGRCIDVCPVGALSPDSGAAPGGEGRHAA